MSKEMMEVLDDVRLEGKEEGRAEGRAEGIEKGRAEGIEKGRAEGSLSIVLNMYKQKVIDLSTAAGALNMTEKEFLKLAK